MWKYIFFVQKKIVKNVQKYDKRLKFLNHRYTYVYVYNNPFNGGVRKFMIDLIQLPQDVSYMDWSGSSAAVYNMKSINWIL